VEREGGWSRGWGGLRRESWGADVGVGREDWGDKRNNRLRDKGRVSKELAD